MFFSWKFDKIKYESERILFWSTIAYSIAYIKDKIYFCLSNLDVIWRHWHTLASSQPINPEKFGELHEKTLEQYMSCAQWYDIPPSLHRVLVYGKEGHTLAVKTTSGRRLKKIQCLICSMEWWTSVIPLLWPCLLSQKQCQKNAFLQTWQNSCWHQNLTHLQTAQNQKMFFPLFTAKKKKLLISMYQYAMMLTCHLTQNNVNQQMIFLCMAYAILKIFNENY